MIDIIDLIFILLIYLFVTFGSFIDSMSHHILLFVTSINSDAHNNPVESICFDCSGLFVYIFFANRNHQNPIQPSVIFFNIYRRAEPSLGATINFVLPHQFFHITDCIQLERIEYILQQCQNYGSGVPIPEIWASSTNFAEVIHFAALPKL